MWKYPALLCLIYALSCGSWAQIQPAAQPGQTQSSAALKLADGTPIKLRIGQMLSSADAHTGEVVRLEVAEDVCVGNSVVIFSGTTASAVVTKTNSKKVKGAARQLALSVDSLNLADGTKALLRGTNESQGEKVPADEAKSRHLTFMPSAPPYPVVNGRDLIIPKGTAVTAYISGDLLLDESRFVSRKPSADNAEAAVPIIAATPVPSQPTELNIFSEPFGAEIDLDGAFIGNTPFRVIVPAGQHLISLRLAGYGPWKKMISATGGSLEVDADLSPGGINGDVVSHCSTPDCVDSSVSNVAKKPNQKQVRQAPTPPQ